MYSSLYSNTPTMPINLHMNLLSHVLRCYDIIKYAIIGQKFKSSKRVQLLYISLESPRNMRIRLKALVVHKTGSFE